MEISKKEVRESSLNRGGEAPKKEPEKEFVEYVATVLKRVMYVIIFVALVFLIIVYPVYLDYNSESSIAERKEEGIRRQQDREYDELQKIKRHLERELAVQKAREEVNALQKQLKGGDESGSI